jgi:hypothetical protein
MNVGDYITWTTANGPKTAQICEISESGYWVSLDDGKVVLVGEKSILSHERKS